MKKYSLIDCNGVKFVCLNADKPLLNNMCNSRIFRSGNEFDSNLSISAFDYFNVKMTILESLDMRTKKAKLYVKEFGYFSASKLNEL